MARKKPPLKIIPLGGLDGIGKNMTAFECGNDMLLVDAGLMFPDDDQPGIDLVLPDYTYVLENEDKLRGIIITHGHEDHRCTSVSSAGFSAQSANLFKLIDAWLYRRKAL